MSEAGPAGRTGEGSRARLVFAGTLALALAAALAGALLVGGGDEERDFAAAPERCVEEWNGDPEAVTLGRHQADPPPSGHGYRDVQVTTLEPNRGIATDPDEVCALIFASPTLSEEPESAVLIRLDEVWQPLGGLEPPLDRLEVLQREAQNDYNAELDADGSIDPL